MNETNTETKPTAIHPAIDYTANHAYVGQKVQNRHSYRLRSLTILSDNRSRLDFHEVTDEIRNVHLKYANFNMEQRWSDKGIKDFIDHGVEPIESTKLFSRIRALFIAYIELPDKRLYDFLTLWSIGTYFHRLFNAYPYVYVGGILESGKSKLMTLCSMLCFNSVSSGDSSVPSLFRLIQSDRCSVFLDEAESLSNRYTGSDMRKLLLNGYKKGSIVTRARRNEQGDFESDSFEVYSPKMLVNIEGLESVLSSRCIHIIMQRGSNRVVTSREVITEYPIWQQIRDLIYPFMLRNWKTVRQICADLQNDTTLRNRDWEIWKSIFVLAKFFGNDILREMKGLAIEITSQSQYTDSELLEIVLSETLVSIVDHDDFYRLADIKSEMSKHLQDDEYLSSKQLGNLLRKLGFCYTRRIGTGYEYFLIVSKVRTMAQQLGVSECSELSEHPGEQDTEEIRTTVEYVEVEKCQEEKSE
jgi:hypothetical protein